MVDGDEQVRSRITLPTVLAINESHASGIGRPYGTALTWRARRYNRAAWYGRAGPSNVSTGVCATR